MSFCTSIHCMDGRIQKPLQEYMQKNYQVKYVDSITEAGPCRILANRDNQALLQAIIDRINISIDNHGSQLIAVSGHFDCAGNPVSEAIQKEQVVAAINYLTKKYTKTEIIGLWVDSNWKVNKIY